MRRLALVAAVTAQLACSRSKPAPPPAATLTVLATGDGWGEVEPCG